MRTTQIILALALAGAAYAEKPAEKAPGGLMKLDMDQLSTVPLGNVYSASKAKQKAARAPATVTVITALDVRRYGWRNLADILRSVRGFYVTNDRNYSYVGVRGFGRPADYNSRVLVLIDNHRINDPIYGAAYVGNDGVLDVDLIDRVEVVRGPSSSLYGTGAFFAVVNIFTRTGAAMKTKELNGEVGHLGTHRGRVTLGHEFDDGSHALASFTGYGSDGARRLFFPEFAGINGGIAQDADRETYDSAFAKVEHKGFTLDYGQVKRDKTIPTASFGTVFNSNGSSTVDQLKFVHGRYDRELSPRTSLMAQAYANQSEYVGTYVNDPLGTGVPTDFVNNKDLSFGSWWVGNVQLTEQLSPRARLVVGAEYQKNQRVDQSNFDENPFVLRLDDRRKSFLWGAYTEAEVQLMRNLTFNAGVRYDFFSQSGETTNPRLALIATPRDGTVLKLLYGTAFRAPNNFELFYADGGISQKPAGVLKNESIATYEGVWEQQLTDGLRGTAAYYYYQMYDLVDQIIDPADGLIVFTNQDVIDAKGVELELAGRFPRGIEGRLSYALQRTRVRITDAELTNSPQNQAKANLSIPLADRKYFFSLDGQYVGGRLTAAGGRQGGYSVVNATLFSQKLLRSMDLSATVYNVFDRKFADLGGPEHVQEFIPQDGRNFRLKATTRF